MKPLMKEIAVIGHRANSSRILRFYRAVKTGVIEIDVRRINQEIKVIHGPNDIKRATPIGEAFSRIDYFFFYRDPLLPPMALKEYLQRLDGFRGVMIDIVGEIDAEELLNQIPYIKHISYYFSSTNHRILKELKKLRNNIFTSATLQEKLIDPATEVRLCKADAATVKHTALDRGLLEDLHKDGIKVIVWTVNDQDEAAHLAEMGVDAIITDRPDKIRKKLLYEGYYITNYLDMH